MKKSFVSLLLAVCLAFTIALPASAVSSLTPEELYQEYLRIADEVNAEYGTDVSIIPFEELNLNNMPSLEEVYTDVTTLAAFFANAETSLATLDSTANAQTSRGIGNHPVSTVITKTWDGHIIKFLASGTVVVNKKGSTYVIQYLTDPSIVNTQAPSGFNVSSSVSARWIESSSHTSAIVTRPFVVTYGAATKNYTINASMVLSTTTGNVTFSPA